MEKLEYKSVLPPARGLGQIISAFANSKGGFIVLGVSDNTGKVVAHGLSEDFHANSVTHKAIDMISPRPEVAYQYITFEGKRLYVIKVNPSSTTVSIEGKIYVRKGDRSLLTNPPTREAEKNKFGRIQTINEKLNTYKKNCTDSKSSFIDHYQGIINLVDDLENLLYPESPFTPTNNQEGKILMRILFASCADNFETYLSNILYEIFLASPESLKSAQTVTIKEVLDCTDMQEFVYYWAKKKLGKLQKGSVKGFINENNQISSLNVIDETQMDEIERILQIRHLYSHRNGVVDEKFIQYHPGLYNVNDTHQLSIDEMLNYFVYLLETVNNIDKAAIEKYSLSTSD
ncbi:MAG: ATP-binding protein [Sphingobacteriales bacterium JAD_PAG50586_3]|nr:MAG: ATP-binding protein [Sphingobacteriales bacterium JAD_PAG50586_3]